MTGETGDPAADGIEQGKRLVRSGGDKGLSLAERLSQTFDRLTWRTPIHSFRLKGRYPLKLIAVPDDPLFGDAARGQALIEGRIAWRGDTREIAGLDFRNLDVPSGFADYLQSFAWLRDLSSVATRAKGAPIAEGLMSRWLIAHADKVAGAAWRPDIWGWRILFWTAHAPLILSSTDLVYRSKVLNTLARGARHLDRGADKTPPGPKRVAAWCGLIAAGLLIPGGDPRRVFGEAGLARALDTALFEDGGAVSRAPDALLDMAMLLAILRECYAARRLELPEAAEAALARMIPALLGVCHADRGLASWQGGGPVPAERVAQIVEATGVRTRPLKQAREWGYQRLTGGNAVLIMDAAPPPVARVVDGGCASTLAFEFSDGAARLIVNCGGARGVSPRLPRELVEALRTTAAHSTLTLSDSNSTAILADGSLGKGVAEVELSRQESDGAGRIEASHDGYVRRFGFVHRRQLVLTGDGRELRGEDSLLPRGRRRRPGTTPFAIRFHLGRGVEASPTADGLAAVLRVPGGALWQFRVRGDSLAIEESLWIDGDGRPVATQQLVVTGTAEAGGASVSWALKRAR
ncbi:MULTISPECIES: heparinase II/III family protein [unclassified Sphingomonas]|uniref:heparinase II/III family protein n=1 Tax=unclassified Sphingomonas TaxID=196159 RepID=UPI00092B77D1|nr:MULTISPECIES: heparinase II/III family protein [unclassified Sphingomonas]MBN8849566.1 heparinase II/III family protein [Sphingomonas sp.]OJV31071.1 MAG: heparinase [Sphingomonas sp. 67-36]